MKRGDPQNVHVWALELSCETPASHDSPRGQTCTAKGPREDLQRAEKRTKFELEEGKKKPLLGGKRGRAEGESGGAKSAPLGPKPELGQSRPNWHPDQSRVKGQIEPTKGPKLDWAKVEQANFFLPNFYWPNFVWPQLVLAKLEGRDN